MAIQGLSRFLLLFSVFAAGLVARPAEASAETSAVPVCIARAAPGVGARTVFSLSGGFDCTSQQRALGPGDFWIRSAASIAASAGREHTVQFTAFWSDAITLHVLYADGAIRSTGFTKYTAAPHLLLGGRYALRIPAHDAAPVRLLWRVSRAGNVRGVILDAALSTPVDDARRETGLAAMYGAFAGMCLALVICNLALWAALRQRFQLAYCALIVMLLGYVATSSGITVKLMPGMDVNLRLRMSTVLLATGTAMVILFARTFFERRVFGGRLREASSAVIVVLLATAFTTAVLAPWRLALLDRLVSVTYLSVMALVPAVLWRAWRLRSNYLWLFALAWGAPIVLAGVRIAASFGFARGSGWFDRLTICAMTAEVLISSLGIAYRVHLLGRERDRAREQEIAARLLADTDPLTGLMNRRAFLHQAIGRAGSQTLMIADLDHFKAINETIGHDGGDEVLRVFARALKEIAPPGALVARLGGEEFALVADADAPVSPGAILDALRATRMPFDLSVTTSIGTCTGPLAREADWKTLYRSADRALYAAKAAGRDRARDAAALPLAA